MKCTAIKILTKSGAEKVIFVQEEFGYVIEMLNGKSDDYRDTREHPAVRDHTMYSFTSVEKKCAVAIRKSYIYMIEEAEYIESNRTGRMQST